MIRVRQMRATARTAYRLVLLRAVVKQMACNNHFATYFARASRVFSRLAGSSTFNAAIPFDGTLQIFFSGQYIGFAL